MKAIILARVSTPEQKESGLSLPAQNTRLEKYCLEHKLEVWKVFEFDETAYKAKRKDFAEVIRILKESKEPTALCCDKIDRLIRNFTADLVLLEELRKEGMVELHFPSDNIILHKDSPASDLFRFTIGISLARYYSDSISDNVKRAIEQKLRKGEWPGKAPCGYRNIDLEDKTKWIEPDPERADLAAKLFEWYATGQYSMELLRRKVKEEGLTNNTHLGKSLSKGEIDYTLKNPFYYGEMKCKGKLYPHKYAPLITKELFDQVQKVKQSWNKRPFQYAAKPYLFRGLLSCADCGCAITFETSKGIVYGHCTNGKRKHQPKEVLWPKEWEIEHQVIALLKGLSLPEKVVPELVQQLRDDHKKKNEYHERVMSKLKLEYDKLENRIEKMYEDKLDGGITQEKYDNKLSEYKKIQEDLLLQMERHSKADETYYIEAGKLLELAQRAYKIYESSKLEEKKELLRYLLQNSKLDGKKLVPTLQMPFDTILTANKTQNWLPG